MEQPKLEPQETPQYDKSDGGTEPSKRTDDQARKTRDPNRSATMRLRIGIGVAALAVAALGWWLYARQFEDTDDAQIDGNIGAISPRVSGTVIVVNVVDNQTVKSGAVLVELDPTDLEIAVAQAKAAVAQAAAAYEAESPTVPITETSNRASVTSAEAEVADAEANLEAAQRDLDQAEANNRFAQLQRERAEKLVASKNMSQADYDQRASAADAAKAAVEAARKRVEQRRAHLAETRTRLAEARQNAPRQLVSREANVQVRKANLELARAQLRQAELNLSYAKVLAPFDGITGKKTVNIGDHVQPGQQLMALTQFGELWVTANYRETQIRRMRPGQRATVHVDAIDRDYQGSVESFAGATGSRYSLLPPENASGNYVKVVQRIPVRIRLEPGQPEMDRLRPGMSVEPKVRVR
jgi:membrane fusion protein, multidrug efflux system